MSKSIKIDLDYIERHTIHIDYHLVVKENCTMINNFKFSLGRVISNYVNL